MTPKEPDIYVERCSSNCPFYTGWSQSYMRCWAKDNGDRIRPKVIGRRFPRWRPLLKAPITIAARRKG